MKQPPADPSQVLTRAFRADPESIRRVRAEGENDDAPARYEFRLTTDDAVNLYADVHETLDHSADAVRMGWMQSGSAPVLWMHDHTQQLGVIESAEIRDGSIWPTVRLGNSGLAKEKRQDIDDGILRNVSVGFRIHGWEHEREDETGDYYRVTDWEPLEASLVTVPADRGTGFGRSAGEKCRLSEIEQARKSRAQSNNNQSNTMPETTEPDAPATQNTEPTAQRQRSVEITNEAPSQRAIEDAVAADRQRQAQIRRVGREWGFASDAERACEDGTSVADFNAEVLNKAQKRTPGTTSEEIGLSKKEKKRYSFTNVFEALATGDSRRAEYEFEVSEALKEHQGRSNDRVAIPTDFLLRGWIPRDPAIRSLLYGERALVGVGVGNSEAAELVDTELASEMFIESLREQTVLMQLGPTMLPGLVGNVQIPRELTNPAFEFVAEDAEPTDGNYTMDNVTLTFGTVASRISFTRQAGKTSTPGLEGLLTRSIRRGLGIAIESNAINGDGAGNNPTGILNTSGIGSVTSGGTITHGNLLELEEDLGTANADTGMSVGLTNSHGKKLLLETKKDAGSGLFLGTRAGDGINAVDTDIGRIYVTNNVPANLGVGTDKTGLIYGNISSLLIGMWGGVEMIRDTATKVATGGVVLRIFQDLDINVARPAEFSAIQDLT